MGICTGDFRGERGASSFVHRAAGPPLEVRLIDFVHESLSREGPPVKASDVGASVGGPACATSFFSSCVTLVKVSLADFVHEFSRW